jgi:hypothetical protein
MKRFGIGLISQIGLEVQWTAKIDKGPAIVPKE